MLHVIGVIWYVCFYQPADHAKCWVFKHGKQDLPTWHMDMEHWQTRKSMTKCCHDRGRSSPRPQRNAVDSAKEKPKGIERSDQRTSNKERQTKHSPSDSHSSFSSFSASSLWDGFAQQRASEKKGHWCSLGLRPKRLYDNQVPPIAIAIIATHAFDQIWSNLCLHVFVRIQAKPGTPPCSFTSYTQAPRKTVNYG